MLKVYQNVLSHNIYDLVKSEEGSYKKLFTKHKNV